MPAVDTELSLDWVVFAEADDATPCEQFIERCSNEATHVARYTPFECGCPNSFDVCWTCAVAVNDYHSGEIIECTDHYTPGEYIGVFPRGKA